MKDCSLTPDIRSLRSSVTTDGNNIEYYAFFSKNIPEIKVRSRKNGILTVDAPIGTQIVDIENSIRNYFQDPSKNQDTQSKNEEIRIIHIREFDIPYVIIINQRRKNPFINAWQDGVFKIELPELLPEKEITAMLESEKEWLFREYYQSLPECPPVMEQQTIRINDTKIGYTIHRNPRVKRITLKIHGNGNIEVSAPFDAKTNHITSFIQSKIGWIAPKIGLNSHLPQPSKDSPDAKPGHDDENTVYTIEYNGKKIPYHIIRNKRAKRVSIKIDREKKVRVICPPRFRISDLSAFVNEKAGWIYEHTICSTHPLPPKRQYRDGEVWPFLGVTITTRIIKGDRPSYEKRENELFISVPVDFTEYHEKELIKQAMSAFYSHSLQQFSLPRFQYYAQMLGITVPQIKIRDQKTKWGACTPHSITLNLRLCMASPEIIDYVIAHELSHKVHPDHSPGFWNTVEQIMPDYRQRKEKLKKDGYSWVL